MTYSDRSPQAVPQSTPTPSAFSLKGNSYAALGDDFGAAAQACETPAPQWLMFNSALAHELGLAGGNEHYPDVRFFTGEKIIPGAAPIAQAYAGHQFGSFNPSLGDGRALLLGDAIDSQGKPWNVQLKGSGPTPFSRRGDGKSALGPVIREYVLSEAVHALGVPTTRALAALTTGDSVYRETVLPGGIMTRIAASHIRVGTFEYFASRGMLGQVKQLADYVIERHYPECLESDRPYYMLLERVQQRQASLVAKWLQLGFVHGVMNTDNSSVCGETIDYGPCAFIDNYRQDASFSSIDTQGRYAYNQQAPIANWNIARLAECFIPLIDASQDRAIADLESLLKRFPEHHQKALATGWDAKLGVLSTTGASPEQSTILANDLLKIMEDTQVDFTLTFRHLGEYSVTGKLDDWPALFGEHKAHAEQWLTRWKAASPKDTNERGLAMRNHNPALIPRNHRIEQLISEVYERLADAGPIEDVRAPIQAMFEVVTKPYSQAADSSHFAEPPTNGGGGYQTFCGT